MNIQKKNLQLIWGIALILAGIGVFIRIPQVMPRIQEIPYFLPVIFFIRLCFYVMGVILVGGGIKKLYNAHLESENNARDQ